MLHDFFSAKIRENFSFEPTEQQEELIRLLGVFLASPQREKLFMLKGYAGTGKTSLIASLVKALCELKQDPILLAPTGRAAKVLSSYSGFPAYTIHKNIYRQKNLGEFKFQIGFNKEKNRLFIVDEASMISNSGFDSTFGSGRLLDDLIEYVYSGEGCSLLILGDTAQLPPVLQSSSPALEAERLKGYGLEVAEYTLTQVVRQASESGILHNATALRRELEEQNYYLYPKFQVLKFSDIVRLESRDFVDELQRAYNEVGEEDCVVITRSNKRANMYNEGIRNRVLMKEDELSNGDLLMVTKNNYFWSRDYKEIDFIANGDIVEVTHTRRHQEMYGYRFVDLSLRSIDNGWEIDARICLDILYSESPAHANELNQKLFDLVGEDYPEITNKRERVKKIMESEFFNAMHVKFAYAITCHKAQGGQWKQVFIDQGLIKEEQLGEDYYRWLYTALTRASQKVFLSNFADEFFDK